jgi:hypothetical protein
LIHELDLRQNGQFTFKSFNYKGYRNGVPTEPSAWAEDRGQVTQQADTLRFELREETVRDSFYPGTKPQTKATTGYLFNNCTFRLSGDSLELTHTSDDAPYYRSTYTRLRSKFKYSRLSLAKAGTTSPRRFQYTTGPTTISATPRNVSCPTPETQAQFLVPKQQVSIYWLLFLPYGSMRFLLIVLLAFLLVRIGTSCDNNGRIKTATPAKGQLSASARDSRH